MLLLDPLFKRDDVARHIPHFFDGAAALDVEGVQNILRLGADGGFVGDVIGDGPHLLPVELFGVQPHAVVEVGLVDVQVHHAGVGPADLREVQIAEAAAHLGGFAPVGKLGLDGRVAALHHAGDDGMALAGALKVGHHLAHGAAGVQFAQPFGGVGVGVVRRAQFLDVDQHHRHVQVAHGGQHVVAGGVGQQLQHDEVDVGGAELVARGLGLLFGGDDAAVHQLNTGGEHRFKVGVLALKLRHQAGELRQVRAQRDGEYAHAGLGRDQRRCHCGFTSWIVKLLRMASRAACRLANSPAARNWTIRLPRAVPSVGPAQTGRPVALAVLWFK